MATVKELAIKFSEQGLQELKSRIDADAKKITKNLESVVEKAREVGSAMAAANAGALNEDAIKGLGLKGIKDLEALKKATDKAAREMTNAVNQSFKRLGVTSEEELRKQAEIAKQAYAAITKSGVASAQEIARAQRALSQKLISFDPLEAAFQELGIKSAASLEQMRNAAIASFTEINGAGKAAISDVINTSRSLAQTLIDTDPTIRELQKLNKIGKDEIRELTADMTLDFQGAARQGVDSAKEIEAAFKRAQARLAQFKLPSLDDLLPAQKAPSLADFSLQTTAELKQQRAEIISSFRDVAATIDRTTKDGEQDFRRLQAAVRKSMADINTRIKGALGKRKIADLTPLQEAFKELGVTSEEVSRKMTADLLSAFTKINGKGQATLADVLATSRALSASLINADPALKELQRLKAVGQDQIEQLTAVMADEFQRASQQGERSAEAIQEAFQKAQARIASLVTNITTGPAPAPAAKPTPTKSSYEILNLPDPAEVQRRKQQIIEAYRDIVNSGQLTGARLRAANAKVIAQLNDLDDGLRRVSKSARESRGWIRRLNATLASLAFETTGALFAIGAVGAGIFAPFKAVGDATGRIESMRIQLANFNDTAAQTERDVKFLEDFAFSGRQPFALKDLQKVFLDLKTNGIDPTQGALQTLVDTLTATKGVDVEALKNASRALGQIAAKGKLTSEELSGQLAESISGAVKLTAEAFNITTDQLFARLKAGSISAREFYENFFEFLEERFQGAAERSLKTWEGAFTAFRARYEQFKVNIGRAGLFDAMIEQLERLRAKFDEWDQDGTTLRFAEQMSSALTAVVDAFVWMVETIAKHGDELAAVFKGLLAAFVVNRIVGAIGTLVVGFQRLRAAWAVSRTAATAFGTAMALLGRTMLVAAGPAGWITLLGVAVWELRDKWLGAADAVEEYGRRKRMIDKGGVLPEDQLKADRDAAQRALDNKLDEIEALEKRRARLIADAVRFGDTKTQDQYIPFVDSRIAVLKAEAKKLEADRNTFQQALLSQVGPPGELASGDPYPGLDSSGVEQDADEFVRILRDTNRAIADAAKDAQDTLKQQLNDSLISYREFVELRTKTEKAAILAQIANLEDALSKAADADKRQKLQVDIQILKTDLAKNEREAVADLARFEKEQSRLVSELKVELLELEGKTAEAVAGRMKLRFSETIQQLEREKLRLQQEGDLLTADKVQRQIDVIVKIVNLTEARAEFDDLAERISTIQADQARQELALQTELEAGLITEYDLRQKLLDLHHRTAAAIRPLIQRMKELAAATGNEQMIQLLRDYEAQLAALEGKTDQTQQRIISSVNNAGADMFDDFISGAKTASEAMQSFGEAVIATIRRIIAEKLTEQIFGKLLGNFGSGIGGLFSLFGGKSGGGEVQAKAGGGLITGPGTGTSDSILMGAEAGSFVVRAAAVRKYGRAALDRLAAFADGGQVPVRVSNGEYLYEPGSAGRLGGLLNLINDLRASPAMLADYLGSVRGYATGGTISRSLAAANADFIQRPNPAPTAASAPQALRLEVSDNILNMTMRDILEREFANIASTR